jgi:hypothetical protein
MPKSQDDRIYDNIEKRIEDLEEKIKYYDKMAARWGGMMIATVTIFSFLGFMWDKIGNKLAIWLSK